MNSLFRPFFVLAGLLNGPKAAEWQQTRAQSASTRHYGDIFDTPLSALERHGLEMMSAQRHLMPASALTTFDPY